MALKRPTSTKQAAQVSQVSQVAHVTQVAPVSQAPKKTTVTSASYYSPTYASYSFPSSPIGHVIASNDNSGPIREVPAPNLGPKPSGALSVDGGHHISQSFDSDLITSLKESSAGFGSGIKSVDYSSIVKGAGYDALFKDGEYKTLLKGSSYNTALKDADYSSLVAGQQSLGVDYSSLLDGHQSLGTAIKGVGYSSLGQHSLGTLKGVDFSSLGQGSLSTSLKSVDYGSLLGGQQSLGGAIKGVDYSSLGQHSLGTSLKGADYSSIVTGPQVLKTNIKAGEYATVVKGAGLDVSALGASAFGKDYSLEVSNSQQGSTGLTDLFKDDSQGEKHNAGYEVREHHHLPLNDHIVKSQDGTKLYYAPDPDPSLPVYKVPPTKDPHSTPSNGQQFSGYYIPQMTHSYAYVQDGSVGQQVATLTPQELYQLLHGYPTVLSQPLMTYGGSSYSDGALPSSDSGQQYYHLSSVGHHGSGSGSSGSSVGGVSSSSSSSGSSSSSFTSSGNSAPDEKEIAYYLQHPEIHNLLHNTPEVAGSHDSQHSSSNYYSQLQQTVYSPQNRYTSYLESNQQRYSHGSGNTQSASPQTFTDSTHDDYEPEASESRTSAIVIRQTEEGSQGSQSDLDLPEDSESNALNVEVSDNEATTEDIQEVHEFKNMPEVPFYSSLPSEQAAKTLAGLQAAGSVANNYLNQLKATNGEQDVAKDETATEENVDDNRNYGTFQLSGFKKLDDIEDDDTVAAVDEHVEKASSPRQTTSSSTKKALSREGQRSTERTLRFSSVGRKGADYSEAELSNETFGKRLRPK